MKSPILHTLFAQRNKNKDVLIFEQDWQNDGALKLKAIFPFLTTKQPDKRNKYIQINCWTYRLRWL